jgi:hypothetical protein
MDGLRLVAGSTKVTKVEVYAPEGELDPTTEIYDCTETVYVLQKRRLPSGEVTRVWIMQQECCRKALMVIPKDNLEDYI